jgi:post-segregation antitoxin (ccd killing protein)
MPEIATIIETAIQAETSSTETVTWDNTNDRFIISSASTIADSYVSELGTSTGTV